LIIFKPFILKMMKFAGLVLFASILLFSESHAQSNPITGGDSTFRVITTAVPFLMISPDARHAALGDAGVATSPDAASAFWNPAKLVFIENQAYGGSFSYTPWLGKLVNDMWIAHLSGFYKITREQSVGLAFKYFDLGDIFLRGDQNQDLGTFNPREFAFDVTYSRMLTENLSVGLTGRYIHSNLTGTFSNSASSVDARPGNSAAADIGVYYTKPIMKGLKNGTLSLAASISNIGAKLSYSDNDNKDFLPTNLRFGSAYTMELDPFNTITFVLDFNKLMVPSPPVRDANGNIIKGKDQNRSLLSGMFGSFADAPDGFSEELKEFVVNSGIEYWYNKTFAARMGYFLEAKEKGNRKYMTLGVGFRKDKFGIDVAYLVPTNKREHPLAETIRFSLIFQVAQILSKEETVTD
jgi:hypothetical protein